MATMIQGLRPVVSLQERDFGILLGKVLSASRAIQSEEYLRGREEQLAGIKQAAEELTG